jgi:hypothetical protein
MGGIRVELRSEQARAVVRTLETEHRRDVKSGELRSAQTIFEQVVQTTLQGRPAWEDVRAQLAAHSDPRISSFLRRFERDFSDQGKAQPTAPQRPRPSTSIAERQAAALRTEKQRAEAKTATSVTTHKDEIAPAVSQLVDLIFAPTQVEANTAALETLLAKQADSGAFGGVDESVLAHTSLVTALRSGVYGEALSARIEVALLASWQSFTGKLVEPANVRRPLPPSVLRDASHAVRALHQASNGLIPGGEEVPSDVIAALEKYNSHSAQSQNYAEAFEAISSFLMERGTGHEVLLEKAASLLASHGGDMALGAAFSWTLASLAESYGHDFIYHADKPMRAFFAKLGPVGQMLLFAWESHAGVHHGSAWENQVTQFKDAATREKLEKRLRSQGKGRMVDEEFGNSLSWATTPLMLLPSSPFYAAMVGTFAALDAHPTTYVGVVVPALLMPMGSKFVHRYFHMKDTDVSRKASLPMRLFVQSMLGQFLKAYHDVHHARPQKEGANYNLLLIGGDYIRGKASRPTQKERDTAKRLGM